MHPEPRSLGQVATTDEVPSLVTGAATLDAPIDELTLAIPELLDPNALLPADCAAAIPFTVIAERHEHASPSQLNRTGTSDR